MVISGPEGNFRPVYFQTTICAAGDVMPEQESQHLVLVVEDDDNIATALEFVVGREGHRFARIADGLNAVEAIRTMRPRVVLLDVMLPGRSGYEICREVREDAMLGSVRIVIMTAQGSATQQARSMSLGANAFLPKPFELGKLREIIREQIGPG